MTQNNPQFARRKRVNTIALALSIGAMAFGLVWLVWILFEIFRLGFAGLSMLTFTQDTPPPMEVGGLRNALIGSLIMVSMATCVGAPIGVLAGIYLAEYDRKGWFGNLVRFTNDILLSAPSIVIGLFVYVLVVSQFRHYSAWAGALALALLVIPVVIRTTENMLLLVPDALREASFALGMPRWRVISNICLKAARAGVLTGILLAVARIAGETAPLLFTALSNDFSSLDVNQPMANLPMVILKFAMSNYDNWKELAWAAVLIITMTVLALNILARLLGNNKT